MQTVPDAVLHELGHTSLLSRFGYSRIQMSCTHGGESVFTLEAAAAATAATTRGSQLDADDLKVQPKQRLRAPRTHIKFGCAGHSCHRLQGKLLWYQCDAVHFSELHKENSIFQ